MQQLKLLGADVGRSDGASRDSSSRPGQARRKAHYHRIANDGHDDGYAGGGLQRSTYARRRVRNNDIHLEAYEFLCERRKALVFAVGKAPFQRDVLPIDKSMLAQTLDEGVTIFWVCIGGSGYQYADPPQPPRLLRLGGERRGENRETCEKRPPVHHWINWSTN